MIIIAQFLNYFKDSHQIFTQHRLVENTGQSYGTEQKDDNEEQSTFKDFVEYEILIKRSRMC